MPIFVNLLIIDNNDEKMHKQAENMGRVFVKMGKMRVFSGRTSVLVRRKLMVWMGKSLP